MSGYLTKTDVVDDYSDQIDTIRGIYYNRHRQDTYIKTRIIEEQQKKQKYLEYVRGQINGYLTGTSQISPDQILIIIHAMIGIIKQLDDNDRQSLVDDIYRFSRRFDRCMPFIDLSDTESRDLLTELELSNALFLSMNIPIQLTIDMDTSGDNIFARSLEYT